MQTTYWKLYVSKVIPVALLLLLTLTGCASQQPVKISMQPKNLDYFKDGLDISLIENKKGIAVAYVPTNVDAVAYTPEMIAGALIATALLEQKENAGPKKAAQIGANKISELIKPNELNQDLIEKIKADEAISNKMHVKSIGFIKPENQIIPKGLVINMEYAIDVNAEIFFIMASVTLYKEEQDLRTKKIKKANEQYTLYHNNFYYFSKFHPSLKRPELEIQSKVDEVKKKYIAKYKKLPKKGYIGYEDLQKDIRIASRDYSVVEKSELSLHKWLDQDANKLRDEIQLAHNFIVRQIYRDYTNYDIPKIDGKDRILETPQNDRYTQIIGSGIMAGQIESLPLDVFPDSKKLDFYGASIYIYANGEHLPQKSK